MAPDETLAVAVSGGPDSIGLLALAVAAFPGRVTALTVDHGLRADSADEAAAVAAQCAARGIAHVTLAWEGPRPRSDVQAAARTARYALMADWCASHGAAMLLTAHTLEDQAETLLMRLARGSGVAGLAGVRACRRLAPGVELVRPVLGMRHADLRAAAAGWAVTADPSNTDPRFGRTRVRGLLAREAVALPAAGLAASAAHLAAAEAALAWVADTAWAGRVTVADDRVLLDAAGLPDEVRRRLLARAVTVLAPDTALRGAGVMRAVVLLDSGATTTLGGVRMRPGSVWVLQRSAPRREKRG